MSKTAGDGQSWADPISGDDISLTNREFRFAVLVAEMAKHLNDEELAQIIGFCDEQAKASGAGADTVAFFANASGALAQALFDRNSA